MSVGGMLPLGWALFHGVWLAVVAYTDLTRQKVYRWWSLVALSTGLATAWGHADQLALGGLLLVVGMVVWWLARRNQTTFGAGDVWVLTYLVLILGWRAWGALLSASLILLAVYGLRGWALRGSVPAAGFWALGGLLVLLLQAPVADQINQSAAPVAVSTRSAAVSPLPALPVHAVGQDCADQAAYAVGWVGIAEAGTREPRAAGAAVYLRDLAGRCPQGSFFQEWAAALDRYAGGDPAALAAIQQFSAQNADYGGGQ